MDAPSSTLLLLRHAKSSRPAGVDDRDRPLSDRGLRDARAAGRQLHRWGVTCDLVLCSPAERTRETWVQAVRGGAEATEVSYRSEVYEATSAELVELIGGVGECVRTLLVVGHGPGVPGLAQLLAGDPAVPSAPGAAELAHGFPTCGLARLRVSVPWTALAPAAAELEEFLVPRGA